MQRVLDSLEAQLREQQVLTSSTQDEASQYKSTATQMRYLLTIGKSRNLKNVAVLKKFVLY